MATMEQLKKKHPYNIEMFNFHKHYMSLVKLSLKTLNIGPDILSNTFFLQPNVKCIVATQIRHVKPIVNNNNYTEAKDECSTHTLKSNSVLSFDEMSQSLHKYECESKQIEFEIEYKDTNDNCNNNIDGGHDDRNNRIFSSKLELGDAKREKVIGFVIGYPHPIAAPFSTNHIWQIGFMATNIRCLKKYRICNQELISTMIINLYDLIHEAAMMIMPNPNPKLHKNLKHNINFNSKFKCIDFDYDVQKQNTMEICLCIYSPIYQTSGHKIYRKLGFFKAAKIKNYYTTDESLFETIYHKNDDNRAVDISAVDDHNDSNDSNDNNDNINSECNREEYVGAFLFCISKSREKFKLYRLVLAFEYFSYKTRTKNSPKIVEEYIQSAIARNRRGKTKMENQIDFVKDVDIENMADKNSWRRWQRAELAHFIYKHSFFMCGLPYLCDIIACYCIGTGPLIFTTIATN